MSRQEPPTPYKVQSITQVPRLDGAGRPYTAMKIHWTIPTLGYSGDVYIAESAADEATVKATLEAEADRIRKLYKLTG